MLDRIRFWLSEKPLIYLSDHGYGYVVERYNPLSDRLRVRLSRFGYVLQTIWMTRSDYLDLRAKADEQKVRA